MELEKVLLLGYNPIVKLTTDERGRLGSRDLFKPNTSYDGQKTPSGQIVFVELVPRRPPQARLVRRGGRTYIESDHQVTNEDTAAVMAEFP